MELVIFKTIVGSQAYGTSTPESDVDHKEVYVQHPDEILSFEYKEQINYSKDHSGFEVKRFIELLSSGNPTVTELLYMPERCIIEKHPAFDILVKNRDQFITKSTLNAFSGYAIAQIQKARGLDKKMNWEKEKMTRKLPIDFCYVYENGKTTPLTHWLYQNGVDQETLGAVALDHFKDGYAIYDGEEYKGLFGEDSNEIRLSSVKKGSSPLCVINFNKDGYSLSCKRYKEYTTWLEERNTQRYVDIAGHNQSIDGKNLMHCRRLIEMAVEIAEGKGLIVERPNAAELLKIRKGQVSLEDIIIKSEEDIKMIDELKASCNLPSKVDKKFMNEIVLKIRKSIDWK